MHLRAQTALRYVQVRGAERGFESMHPQYTVITINTGYSHNLASWLIFCFSLRSRRRSRPGWGKAFRGHVCLVTLCKIGGEDRRGQERKGKERRGEKRRGYEGKGEERGERVSVGNKHRWACTPGYNLTHNLNKKKKGERRGGVADQKTFSLSTDGESYSGRGDLHRQIN